MDAATASPASRASPRSLHVLLADDDEFSREVVRHLLVSAGHTVHVVGNGRQALEALQSSQRFDVMLLDVQMPELDGFQVVEAIRETERGTARHLPVIALTALDGQGDREQCIDAGMDDYLSKPIRMTALDGALERVTAARIGPGGSPSRADQMPPTPDANSQLLDPATILASCGGDEVLLREMIDLSTPEPLTSEPFTPEPLKPNAWAKIDRELESMDAFIRSQKPPGTESFKPGVRTR